jgi:hypothetical protein
MYRTAFDEWYDSVLTVGIASRENRSVLEAAFDAGMNYGAWWKDPSEWKPEWLNGRHWEYEGN